MWDMGKGESIYLVSRSSSSIGLTVKSVYTTGYTVLALTGVTSIYLAFFV
jgi:hypothetical protein